LFLDMNLPARRTRRAIVHSGAATSATMVLAAAFGVVGWVADLIVVGVIAIVVTIVAAYVLSRP